MINERIKKIRAWEGLSQTAFGQKIGVSRDVINNLELGRVEPKDSIIKLICFTYHVNEEWLRTGQGIEHEAENAGGIIEKIAEKYQLNDLERYLVEGYLSLNRRQREEFLAAIKGIVQYVSVHQQELPVTETRSETEARLLREEADAVERGNGKSSASPATKEGA